MTLTMHEPRICSFPDYGSSAGPEAVELAAMAGLILDPWQEFVLVNALGERDDGRWAAFEVGLNVPRQNGKGSILEARALSGLFLLDEALIIWSAHQFDTSLEAFRRLLALIESTPDFDQRVMRVSRSHGEEGIEFRGGQRIRFRTRTKGGGRGFTGNCLILDEAMILPQSFHGALLPTLSAKSVSGNPQVWYAGSAVDQTVHEHGLVFAKIRARGLRGDRSLAYFEHSADVRDAEGRPLLPDMVTDEIAGDHGHWAEGNPGLEIRITHEHIEYERASMDARTFAVERLGVGDWPSVDGIGTTVIDLDEWDDLVDDKSKMRNPVCLAFDVSPDRSTASISAAGRRRDGLGHVEVIQNGRGTGWVAKRIVELHARHSPVGIVCDGAGPAASLVAEIERLLEIEVRVVNAPEYANACGLLFDAVDQKTLRHTGAAALRSAVKHATKRALGEKWAWSRKNSIGDITPLVACTLAFWGSDNIEPSPTKVWRPL